MIPYWWVESFRLSAGREKRESLSGKTLDWHKCQIFGVILALKLMYHDSRILFQTTSGFKLRIYCGRFMRKATITVSWLAIPVRNTFVFVVARFCVYFTAIYIFVLRWLIALSMEVLILIERIPFKNVTLGTWEHTEFHIFADISSLSFLSLQYYMDLCIHRPVAFLYELSGSTIWCGQNALLLLQFYSIS